MNAWRLNNSIPSPLPLAGEDAAKRLVREVFTSLIRLALRAIHLLPRAGEVKIQLFGFDAKIMMICRPSGFGSNSTLAMSAIPALTRSSSL